MCPRCHGKGWLPAERPVTHKKDTKSQLNVPTVGGRVMCPDCRGTGKKDCCG